MARVLGAPNDATPAAERAPIASYDGFIPNDDLASLTSSLCSVLTITNTSNQPAATRGWPLGSMISWEGTVFRNLLALAVLLALSAAPLAQQTDGGRPSFISEADWTQIKPHIDPERVQWNPYRGLAVRKDGGPYRILDLRTWMGDDFQVVGYGLLKTQLEAAGVKSRYAMPFSRIEKAAR